MEQQYVDARPVPSVLLKRFEERGVRGFASLSKWVERAEFDSDVRGQFTEP